MTAIEKAERESQLFLEKSIADREAGNSVNLPPPSYRYPLFTLMSRTYGLTLLDSELDDIIRVVKALDKEPAHVQPPPHIIPPRTCGNPVL